MIKILEHGKARQICICKKCNCKFEYDMTDTESLRVSEHEFKKFVVCPECWQLNRAYVDQEEFS